jgi:hypothetical protein
MPHDAEAEERIINSPILSRRELLVLAARLGLTCPLVFLAEQGARAGLAVASAPRPLAIPAASAFSSADEAFLEEVEKAGFLFFWEQASPYTGLIKDRSQADGPDQRDVASIASTGFGLTTLCVADRRGWMRTEKLKERVRAALRFLAKRMPHEHGFYHHFIDMHTGERAWKTEVCSIDTAILLCGVLTCRAHFEDLEIRELATRIYERVDWPWMLNGGTTLSHGWKPEVGFLKSRWDAYSELMMLYLLGLGSPTHPLPAETWNAWKRPIFEYDGLRFVGSNAPLFVHQYSHAWFDFRGKRDRYADYFENSVIAVRVHKKWCLALAKDYPDYSEDLWGITSSDSPHGYVAWGGPPPQGPIDGTVVPAAAGGSLAFLPQEALRVLRSMRERFGKHAWKRYGFVDAFNPQTNWFDPDVIGIDVGILLLMAENARTGFVWETFMKHADARRGMERAGFRT